MPTLRIGLVGNHTLTCEHLEQVEIDRVVARVTSLWDNPTLPVVHLRLHPAPDATVWISPRDVVIVEQFPDTTA